ncbi:MAG: PAS domain S-box protein [Deltaproteobacteria bacterium]|nr:PAS domain S-box protein [Deltaproteobacteria bacterium]
MHLNSALARKSESLFVAGNTCPSLLKCLSILFFLLWEALFPHPASPDVANPRIFVLNSYHYGMPFSDDEVRGLISVLPSQCQFFVEYMDCKRMYGNAAYLQLLLEQYRLKYAGERFDAVVSLDDDAFQFLLRHRDKLFPGTPVVFCGVNHLEKEMLQEQEGFTGVVETTDIADSIEIGLHLHGEIENVFVITDNTTSGRVNRAVIEEIDHSRRFPARFLFLDPGTGLTMEELLERLKDVPRRSIVYHSDFFQDRDGQTLDPENVMAAVSQASPAPVYVHGGMYVGHGAVGGKVNSGLYQGEAAGRLLNRILKGEPVEQIPVQWSGITRYTFDWEQLERWDVLESALPQGSVVINRKVSFHERHRTMILGAAAVFVLQSFLILYLVWNISHRRTVQKALQESERRLRAVFQAAINVAFIITDARDPEPLVLEFSPGAERLFGYSRNEMVGHPVSVLHLEEDIRRFPEIHRMMREGGEGFSGETTLVRKSGERFPALFTTYPLTDHQKNMVAALGVSIDISALRHAQAALKESEEKYRTVVHNALDAIFIAQDGVIKFPNPVTLQMLCYTEEELARIPFLEHVHPEDRQMVADRHQRRLKGEQVPATYTFRGMNKEGQIKWLMTNLTRIDWEGKPAVLCFMRDITSQRFLEAQLLQAQKLDAVGTLAGGIAHDFNNLLQAVQGYAEVLLMDVPDGKPGHNELMQIRRAATRGSELTRQLLTFSRKVAPSLKPVDVNRIVVNLREILDRTIPKMIHIKLQLVGNLWRIHADASQMEQVLMNLALNARDAMPEGGELIVETGNVSLDEAYHAVHPEITPGDYVRLSISDTGHGMDKDVMQRIFDPFFTTKAAGKGSGLGLAMAYGIVKNHHGHIICQSRPGEGTRFEILFPAIQETEEHEEETANEQLRGGTETILLVDDEEWIRDSTSKLLRAYGYHVLTAPDGESALERFAAEKEIHLVLLDLMMPGMGGRECLVRLLESDPQTRVIVASGFTTHDSSQDILTLGARASVPKPFQLRQLLQVVREVLDADG